MFFSTHLLPDVERVCDDVAIISGGHIVAAGPIHEIRAKFGGPRGRLIVEVNDPLLLREALADKPWVLGIDNEDEGSHALVLTVDDLQESAARVALEITSRGGRLYRLEPREPSLEDVFVVVVMAAGAISSEVRSGVASLLLVKPVSRAAHVVSHTVILMLFVAVAALLGAAVS